MGVKFIDPIGLNLTNVTSGTFYNSSEPTWSSGSTYALGAVAKYAHKDADGNLISFRIYSSKINSNTGNTPPDGLLEDDYWVLKGVDNRYAFLDDVFASTPSYRGISSTASISITKQSGDLIDTIQLMNVVAGGYDVYANGAIVASGSLGAYSYGRQSNLTISVPSIADGQFYSITLHRLTTPEISLGQMVVGKAYSLDGELRYGMRLDSQDFSVNTNNEFGNSILVERPYIKRVSGTMVVPTYAFNEYFRVFTERRAKNTVWILTSDSNYNEAVTFGTAKCSLLAEYPAECIADIQIKGTI